MSHLLRVPGPRRQGRANAVNARAVERRSAGWASSAFGVAAVVAAAVMDKAEVAAKAVTM